MPAGTASTVRRDYSLTGPDGVAAVARGLASATWYSTPLPRAELRALMKRSDGPAIRDTLIWFAALAISGGLGVTLWGSWWAVLPFAVYGVLYGSASDSRWHECGHGTAFKTRWMNDVVYEIASFMIFREPDVWRWSHARHHTDTIVVGRDPEVSIQRPPSLRMVALIFTGLPNARATLRALLRHAGGTLDAAEKSFIPESEHPRVIRTARIWLAILAAVILTALATRSLLPLMLVGLPTIYGAWLEVIFGITQHAGLAEDVLDHRLNCRTVYMNPVFRFIYWNMNYHVEHHMFPLVPYHALPALHELMRHDAPAPCPSLVAAYREIIPAVLRQRRDPAYCVARTLPPGARPFFHGPDPVAAGAMAAE